MGYKYLARQAIRLISLHVDPSYWMLKTWVNSGLASEILCALSTSCSTGKNLNLFIILGLHSNVGACFYSLFTGLIITVPIPDIAQVSSLETKELYIQLFNKLLGVLLFFQLWFLTKRTWVLKHRYLHFNLFTFGDSGDANLFWFKSLWVQITLTASIHEAEVPAEKGPSISVQLQVHPSSNTCKVKEVLSIQGWKL